MGMRIGHCYTLLLPWEIWEMDLKDSGVLRSQTYTLLERRQLLGGHIPKHEIETKTRLCEALSTLAHFIALGQVKL